MPRSMLRKALLSTLWIPLATAAPAQQGGEVRRIEHEARQAVGADRAPILPRTWPQPVRMPEPGQSQAPARLAGSAYVDLFLSRPILGAREIRAGGVQPLGRVPERLTPSAGQRHNGERAVRQRTQDARRRTPLWARPVFYIPAGLLGLTVAGYLLWPDGGSSTGTVVVTIPG